MKAIIKIGRDNSNDIIINEPRISRSHAIITDLGNGTYEVKDLGSTNGTFVNGKRITQQIISAADKLEVANSLVNWQQAFLNPQKNGQSSPIQEEAFDKIHKTISIGASGDNDLVMTDGFISNYHAKISLLKNGNYYIQDLGSRNSTFVNGAKIISKNFTKTDIVKIADSKLPDNWFTNKNLKPNFIKDNLKVLIIITSFIILLVCGGLFYFNSCSWFNCYCDLSSKQVLTNYKNSIVSIEHSYYYTVRIKDKTYFVGKNKDFKVIEANTSKENLLPYGTVKGSGCFIDNKGGIITSPLITNPWLFNEVEKNKMLNELVESKIIDKFSLKDVFTVCGETHELKWLANGLVNNTQNYVGALSNKECSTSDSTCMIIRSIKKSLPEGVISLPVYYNLKSKEYTHITEGNYYGSVQAMQDNAQTKDTFYYVKEYVNTNVLSSGVLSPSLPALTEGSPVLNKRGELIGVIVQNKVVYLSRFYKQLK
jgi:pSer/pThr/pTyr-binding forkhead associated (FHA) protein